ncbi:MAG: sugar phosphate isomerase/epimerase [Clostridia bacterium]|nr:sugar phosphate isomerase/epimerase [Clostridia bacterium]
MYRFPVGVIVDSFRLPMAEAVKKAKEVGAQGIQVYASHGDMAPENMTPQKISEFKKLVSDNGLVISALCGDLGGGGFVHPDRNAEKVEKSKRILDLAKELGTDIVTTHIGVVPADSESERYKIMQQACFELSSYADTIQSHFAVETGPEKSIILKKFLDSLNSRGVAVNLDPANLIMVSGDAPVEAVYNLKDYIVHTHAKDGYMRFYENPEIVYGMPGAREMADGEHAIEGDSYEEVPLGSGSVPFPYYLKALEEIGYKGFLTIEREVGADPAKDIGLAVKYLNDIMNEA